MIENLAKDRLNLYILKTNDYLPVVDPVVVRVLTTTKQHQ